MHRQPTNTDVMLEVCHLLMWLHLVCFLGLLFKCMRSLCFTSTNAAANGGGDVNTDVTQTQPTTRTVVSVNGRPIHVHPNEIPKEKLLLGRLAYVGNILQIKKRLPRLLTSRWLANCDVIWKENSLLIPPLFTRNQPRWPQLAHRRVCSILQLVAETRFTQIHLIFSPLLQHLVAFSAHRSTLKTITNCQETKVFSNNDSGDLIGVRSNKHQRRCYRGCRAGKRKKRASR